MDDALAAALARAYNDWIDEFVRADPARLRPVAGLSLHDPAAARAEVERAAGLGFRAVYVRPNPLRGRLLGDAAYEPLWEACAALGLAVGVHEGAYTLLPAAGADRFRSRFALHACSHPLEQMMAFLALLEGGVLEHHPTLRFGFLESGCGWLPYWLWRLDELEYKNLHMVVADRVKMAPSAYFRRQCFISCEPEEPYLAPLLTYLGEDNLLFASDYPHPDHGPEIARELLEPEEALTPRVLRKILWDNPSAFYGLDA
jgi:predicted TIM-barrel fold metal-dependent hydrolase